MAASVTTEPKHDVEDVSSTAELERRKKIEAKMFKNQRRHYKKDTRYVLDLYTLTFDEDETVESVGTIICKPETTFNLFGGSGHAKPTNSAISSHYFEGHAPLTKSKSQPSFDFHSSLTSSFSCSSSVTDFSINPVPPVIKKPSLHAEARLRDSSSSSGPSSLPMADTTASSRKKSSVVSAASLATLETNLHKILARKFADEISKSDSSREKSEKKVEELSFQKAKLLTKAYYRLLRGNDCLPPTTFTGNPGDTGPTSLQVDLSGSNCQSSAVARGDKKSSSSAVIVHPDAVAYHKHKRVPGDEGGGGDFDRKRWQALINADAGELRKMVDGLGHTAKALNEYLVNLLVERDDLLSKQDEMLEEISELADTLLQK